MPRAAYAYASQEVPSPAAQSPADPQNEKGPSTLAELEEESRVDPYDGEVRTFQELRRHYAGFYTPEAIVDYWQNSCRPYLQGFFEGAWTTGAKRHVIEGPRLHWHKGRVTIIQATSRTSFTMELDGGVFTARLEEGGGRLIWSDGEAWARAEEAEAGPLLGEPEEAPALDEPATAKQDGAYSPGQQVKYFSASTKKWILAAVKARNQDGTYNLDVKKHARPEHIRPTTTKPAAPAQDPAMVARWKMQLPRALAEWAAGDHKGFDNLLAARIMATPQVSLESVIHDMLEDAMAIAPTVGVRPDELKEALEKVQKITKALTDADVKVSKQVKRPVAEAAPASDDRVATA
mmetsp:Transcript_34091/g.98109  ORF Transcript_34091/g.98109 Transcript_34091/m.98109 type:complete len:348 (+) Transcript_34091:74-1117(+)